MKPRKQKVELSRLETNDGQLEGLPKNPRWIKDDKFRDLVKSIKQSPEFLDARPLIVYPMGNWHYITLCGNMRLRACRELKMESVPCYVFPKETPIEKLREYTIKDNLAYGQIDWEAITTEWEMEELQDWSFDVPEDWLNSESPMDGEGEQENSDKYSRKIEIPTYEITGEEPPITECIDMEAVERLLDEIDRSGVSEEQKRMLRFCAYRHARINFENMAEYYAHQGAEMQQLMENNALVVIDYDKAVERGFVEMTQRLLDLVPSGEAGEQEDNDGLEGTDYDDE